MPSKCSLPWCCLARVNWAYFFLVFSRPSGIYTHAVFMYGVWCLFILFCSYRRKPKQSNMTCCLFLLPQCLMTNGLISDAPVTIVLSAILLSFFNSVSNLLCLEAGRGEMVFSKLAVDHSLCCAGDGNAISFRGCPGFISVLLCCGYVEFYCDECILPCLASLRWCMDISNGWVLLHSVGFLLCNYCSHLGCS